MEQNYLFVITVTDTNGTKHSNISVDTKENFDLVIEQMEKDLTEDCKEDEKFSLKVVKVGTVNISLENIFDKEITKCENA